MCACVHEYDCEYGWILFYSDTVSGSTEQIITYMCKTYIVHSFKTVLYDGLIGGFLWIHS